MNEWHSNIDFMRSKKKMKLKKKNKTELVVIES